jgi:predicted heme/steroid binding protein
MKKEYSLSTMIYQFQSEICYYSQRQLLATCPYEKAHYERLINARTQQLINVIRYVSNKSNEKKRDFERQKEFTLEELSNYDGANGRAAYVAVNGTVYDVSKEATWGGGTHFGLYAGKDLSAEFMGCHKGMVEMLNKLPKVGILKKT